MLDWSQNRTSPQAALSLDCGRGGDEICEACFWEDDGQDDQDADDVRGGPNAALSLRQARLNFEAFGATDPKFVSNVRPPLPDEV